jgi:hypothetical protein
MYCRRVLLRMEGWTPWPAFMSTGHKVLSAETCTALGGGD